MSKLIFKILGVAALASLAAFAASATPVQITLNGSGQFAISGTGSGAVTLGSGTPFSLSATGKESGSAATSFTLSSLSGPIAFSGSGSTFTSAQLGVTITDNLGKSFMVTGLTLTQGAGGEVTLSGALSGGGSLSAAFNLGASTSLSSSFSTNTRVTPEPSSLALIATGFLALCGLVFFKSSRSAATPEAESAQL